MALAVLWGVQAALAGWLPLVADEAYYLSWSRDLRAGYLDHPPGVAWWVALGGGHARLPGLVLMPVAWVALADAARRWGVGQWRWVPAVAMATPLGFSAGLLATPDGPLVLAWCGALWAVAAGRPGWAGVAVGVGLWAKSAMVVALPGLWWALGLRGGAVALGVAAVVYAPHVVWSLCNDGLPWSFQAGHRRWGGAGEGVGQGVWRGVGQALELVGGQLLVVTPGIAWLAARAWGRPGDGVDRVLRALGLPVLGAWLLMSLGTRVEANWPALAWPATLVLVLRWCERGAGGAEAGGAEAGGAGEGRAGDGLPGRARALRWAVGVGAVMTLGAAVALPVLHAWAPIGRGPPRDGPGLWACLASDPGAAGLPPVAARYQEKALLDAASRAADEPEQSDGAGGADAADATAARRPVPYRRALGHRLSEYDRQPTPSVPACDFIYLAPPEALGDGCAGQVEAVMVCGRPAARCVCRDAEVAPRSGRG